jgi:hypothetical protein
MADVELDSQCKAIFGGVSWPAKRPGFAVIVAMSHEKHFESHDIYLLAEYETFDMRELVRQCGVMDAQYKPMTWYGDDKNEAADRLINELAAELRSPRTSPAPRRCFSVYRTMLVEIKQLYAYIFPHLKRLLDPKRRMLFLKDSKILNYLAAIEEGQIAELELGAYPAIEALAFAVIEMKDQYPDRKSEAHHEEHSRPRSAMC